MQNTAKSTQPRHRESINNKKKIKKKLNHVIRNAKRKYFELQLDSHKHYLKARWKIINTAINKRKQKHSLSSKFKLTNSETIADHFCEYFTNIGRNLVKKYATCQCSLSKFSPPNSNDSIILRAINKQELGADCNNLESWKTLGPDSIPMKMIKYVFSSISDPLLHIIIHQLNFKIWQVSE